MRSIRTGLFAIQMGMLPLAANAQFLPSRWISDASREPVTSVLSADMDDDGINDAIFNSWGMLDYLPGADPTMAQPCVPIGTGASSRGMLAADLDLDGDLDIVVQSATDYDLLVFENLGQGQAWSKHTYDVTLSSLRGLLDLEGDGDTDLIVAHTSGAIYSMKNQGSFVFDAPVLVDAQTGYAVMTWDPDENGIGDLLMLRSNTVYHFANNGLGSFAAPVTLLSGVGDLTALEDLDGDGDRDLLSVMSTGVNLYPRTGTTQFGAAVPLFPGFSYASGVISRHVLDVDGDGDKDILFSKPTMIGTSFLRNDGAGIFRWTGESTSLLHGQDLINSNEAMLMMDMDLDADRDLVYIAEEGNVRWQENIGAGFDAHPVHTGAALSSTPIQADLNDDGLTDVLVPSGGVYRWCRNTGGGVFAAPVNLAQAVGVDLFADADGDGDDDLFNSATSGGVTTISCRPSIGNGVFGAATTIFSATGSFALDLLDDIDGDGDVDVLTAVSSSLHRFFLNDGIGTFTSSSLTISSTQTFHRLIDMDGDGDKDPCYARHAINPARLQCGFARNNAGTSFTMVAASIDPGSTAVTSGKAAVMDVDRDGRLDALFYTVFSGVPTHYKLLWVKGTAAGFEGSIRMLYDITHGGTFLPPNSGPHEVADVDHDGDLDLLAGPSLLINAGAEVFLYPRLIADQSVVLRLVPGDLNNDGLVDLSLWIGTEEVRWTQFEANNDRYGASHPLLQVLPGAFRLLVDFDQDGDTDVLTSVGWHENNGGAVFTEHRIEGVFLQGSGGADFNGGLNIALAADLDGDTDMDLVLGDWALGSIAWMERLPGNTFAQPRAIAPYQTGSPQLAGDIDGDGDLDISVGPWTTVSPNAKWLKNMGAGNFQIITTTTPYYAHAFADYDNDGDLDMAAVKQQSFAWYLALFKNDGAGTFTQVNTFTNTTYEIAATFADIDGDGDLDLVFGRQHLYWAQNLGNGNIQTAYDQIAISSTDFHAIRCHDQDGDGDQDVIAMGLTGRVLLNNGNATSFTTAAYTWGPDGSGAALGGIADLNGDGVMDVVGEDLERSWIAIGAFGQMALSVSVFPEGPYNSMQGQCADALRSGSLLPLSEPYTALGFVQVGGGGEVISVERLNISGPNALVDWVVVELRDAVTPSTRIATHSALLQRDGGIVDVDGVSPLLFSVPAGTYHVAVRHRNHLGVMTATPVSLSGAVTSVDFTNPATQTYGTNPQKQVGNRMVLWAGDATGNGQLRYTGSGNDRDPILLAVGSTTPNNTVTNVYDRRDTNLDGVIKYTGTANDRDIILTNVGSTTPNNTRMQQLP